jgi:hypothetical protein
MHDLLPKSVSVMSPCRGKSATEVRGRSSTPWSLTYPTVVSHEPWRQNCLPAPSLDERKAQPIIYGSCHHRTARCFCTFGPEFVPLHLLTGTASDLITRGNGRIALRWSPHPDFDQLAGFLDQDGNDQTLEVALVDAYVMYTRNGRSRPMTVLDSFDHPPPRRGSITRRPVRMSLPP